MKPRPLVWLDAKGRQVAFRKNNGIFTRGLSNRPILIIGEKMFYSTLLEDDKSYIQRVNQILEQEKTELILRIENGEISMEAQP